MTRWGVDYSHVVGAGWAEHIVVSGVPARPKRSSTRRTRRRRWDSGSGVTRAPLRLAPATPTATHRAQPPAESDGDRDVQRFTPPVTAAPEREPRPTPRPEPRPEPQPDREPSGRECHSSYVPCVPDSSPRDLDCKKVGHRVTVVGPDEYRLDGDDNDSMGCESYPAA